jgi:hypothetical protein
MDDKWSCISKVPIIGCFISSSPSSMSSSFSELVICPKNIDFGTINYDFGSFSDSVTVEIINNSIASPYVIAAGIIHNVLTDFPVDLEILEWKTDSGDIPDALEYALLPADKVIISIRLRINDKSINVNLPRTSYFRVTNRSFIQYHNLSEKQENEIPSLEFTYTCRLCTSIMYLDKSELDFQEIYCGESALLEFMVWNRSESNLLFQIKQNEDSAVVSENEILFYEADNEDPITEDQVITVASFAPKIIHVQVSGVSLGSFKCSYQFCNLNTAFNTMDVVLKGRVVSLHSEIANVLAFGDSPNDKGFLRSLEYGSCHVGVQEVKSLWLANISEKAVHVTLSVPSSSDAKIQFESSDISKKETVVSGQAAPRLYPDENPFPQEMGLSESKYHWIGVDEPSKKESTSLANLCGSMFGSESIISEYSGMRLYDCWFEANYEYVEAFASKRSFFGKTIEVENLQRNDVVSGSSASSEEPVVEKMEIIPERQLSVVLPPSQKVSFNFVLFPTFDHLYPPEEGKELKEEASLTVSYRLLDTTNAVVPDAEEKPGVKIEENCALVEVKYQATASTIEASPTSVDFGICRVSDTYSYVIHFHNCSPVSTTVIACVTSGTNELEIEKFRLQPNENKDISLYFFPVAENPDYKNSIIFKNIENNLNLVTINVYAQIIDSKIIQLHDNFYKLYTSKAHDPNPSRLEGLIGGGGQLPFYGKSIFYVPNINIFKVRNIWNYDLTLQFIIHSDSFIRIVDTSAVNSLSDILKNYDKIQKSHEKSFLASDLEDLKWGDRRLKHSQSLRLSAGDILPKMLRDGLSAGTLSNPSSSRGIFPEKTGVAGLSKDVDALDLLSSSNNRQFRSFSAIESNASVESNFGGDLSPLEDKPHHHHHHQSHHHPRPLSRASSNANLSHVAKSAIIEESDLLLNISKLLNETVSSLIFDEPTEHPPSYSSSTRGNTEYEAADVSSDIHTTSVGKDTQATRSASNLSSIKEIQESYRILQNLYDVESQSTVNGSSAPSTPHSVLGTSHGKIVKHIFIRKGETVDLALLWKPVPRESFSPRSSSFPAESTFRHVVKDWFQIRIHDFIPANLNLTVEELFSSHPDLNFEHAKSLLDSRSVFINEECALSEMNLIQKQINFGRVVVGDTSSKPITLINNSPVACLYSFSKSGSITSGFLTVSQGRKGYIEPFSTKRLDLFFKPTMPCVFEEVLHIKNLLNPNVTQLLTVKAKVLRAESFSLSLSSEPIPQDYQLSKVFEPLEEDFIAEAFKKVLSAVSSFKKPGSRDTSSHLSAVPPSTVSETFPDLCVFRGFGIVGKSPCLTVKFKVKNTTGKKRQLIIDATRDDSIEFLTVNRLHSDLGSKLSSDEFRSLAATADNGRQFSGANDVVRGIIVSRCQFYSEVVSKKSRFNDNDDDETQLLMDQLEKFQQKLKINTRKKKAEKIAKYQKKIDEIILKLSGGGSTKADNNDQEKKTTVPEASSVELGETVDDGSYSNQTEVVYSELVHHLALNPDEEKLITVKISYLPGFHFAPWQNLLPFIGKMRIYETKNEDFVRSIYFGLFLFSSQQSFDRYFSKNELGLLSVPSAYSVDENDQSSNVPIILPNFIDPFRVVVRPLYSFPTKEIEPKYKNASVQTLGTCVKLIKSTKDLVFFGQFHLEHSEAHEGLISVAFDESSTKAFSVSSGFKPFSTKKYGSLHISASETLSSAVALSLGSLVIDEHCVDLSQSKYGFDCSSKKSVNKYFSLVWTPSAAVLSSNDEIKLFGLMNISYAHPLLAEPKPLLVPFVCVYQHATTIKVDRYVTFENVNVGSYSTAQVTIVNESVTDNLHYMIAFEEVLSKEVSGKLEILNGISGIIHPSGEKAITLIFYGYSIGKFEQRAWVRNIKDSFDQKRFTIQANVVLAVSRFVKFLGLGFPEKNSEKYEPVDFGLVQIRSENNLPSTHNESVLSSILPHPGKSNRRNPFALQVQNVSNDSLLLSVSSNLKNQCFVYKDSDCKEAQKQFSLPKSEVVSIYILLKPADIEKSRRDFLSTNECSEDDVRELQGGVKLSFEKQLIDGDVSCALEFNLVKEKQPAVMNTKLFETVLDIFAKVGKSVLSVRNLSLTADIEEHEVRPPANDVMLLSLTGPAARVLDGFVITGFCGSLELKNKSNTFNARYQIIDESNSTIFCAPSDVEDDTFLRNSLPASEDCECRLVVFTDFQSILDPGETRHIKFTVIVKNSSCYGLFIKQLTFYNYDTNEYVVLDLLFCIESSRISCSFQQPAFSENVGEAVLSPVFRKILAAKSSLRIPEFHLNERVWIKPVSKNPEINPHLVMNSTDVSALEKAFYEKTVFFDVSSASDAVLGTIVILNGSSRTISLVPMSELPVYVLLDSNNMAAGGSSPHDEKDQVPKPVVVRGKDLFNDLTASVKDLSSDLSDVTVDGNKHFEFSSQVRKLKQCGNVFSIKPGCEMRVFIKISAKVIENQPSSLQLQKLLLGNVITLTGLLCFVENVSKLQSIFSPPVPDTFVSSVESSRSPRVATSERALADSLHAVYVCSLQSEIFYPRILVDGLNYDLGTIRWNSRKKVTSTIKNLSPLQVLCSLEPLPEWIMLEIVKYSLDSQTDSSLPSFERVIPSETTLPSCEQQGFGKNTRETYYFFPIDPRSSYTLIFHIALAGKLSSNLVISSVRRELLMRFFGKSLLDHSHHQHKETTHLMTSFAHGSFAEFRVLISFTIDSKSMLDITTTAPIAITAVPAFLAENDQTSQEGEIEAACHQTLPTVSKFFTPFHQLGCLFTEYFVVPPPTRLDFNSMNSLIDKFGQLPTKFVHEVGAVVFCLSPELHKKFFFLSQSYTFWLKNTSHEKIEVLIDFQRNEEIDEELSISFKLEDSLLHKSAVSRDHVTIGHENTQLAPRVPASSTQKKIFLESGESVSLVFKIVTKYSSRWDEEKLVNKRNLFPINNEVFSDSFDDSSDSLNNDPLSALVQRLRRFRIGPCVFGAIRLTSVPVSYPHHGSLEDKSDASSHTSSALTESICESTEIKLKGNLALGNTMYLLPAKHFPTTGNGPDITGNPSKEPLMYQDKKGYWSICFPGVKVVKSDDGMVTPSSSTCYQLWAYDFSFYLVNPSVEELNFSLSTNVIRFPGLNFLVADATVDQIGQYYCDTVTVIAEPREGVVPANSAILLKVKMQQTDAGISDIYDGNEPANRYFREEYSRFTHSYYQHQQQDHVNSSNSEENNIIELNKYFLLSIPLYIWGKRWLLHPPIPVRMNFTCNEDVSMILSAPISSTNRSSKNIDIARHLSTRESSRSSVKFEEFERRSRSNSEIVLSKVKSVDAEELKRKYLDGKRPLKIISDINSFLILKSNTETHVLLDSLEESDKSSVGNPEVTTDTSPKLTDLNESTDDELDGLKIMDYPKSSLCRFEYILNIRGITPFSLPTSPSFSFTEDENPIQYGIIDLGKQSTKADRIEWLITVENVSKYHTLRFNISDYSVKNVTVPFGEESSSSTDISKGDSGLPWLVMGRNGGILSPRTATSVMIYFDRSSIGKFLSYLYIQSEAIPIECSKRRKLVNVSESFLIKASFEVSQYDKHRRPSLSASSPLPTLRSFSIASLQESGIPPLSSMASNRDLSGLSSMRALYTKWFTEFISFDILNSDLSHGNSESKDSNDSGSGYFIPISSQSESPMISLNCDRSLRVLTIYLSKDKDVKPSMTCSLKNLTLIPMKFSVDCVPREGRLMSLKLLNAESVDNQSRLSLSCSLPAQESVILQVSVDESASEMMNSSDEIDCLLIGELICKLIWIDPVEYSFPIYLRTS